jgi:hypothetical protein
MRRWQRFKKEVYRCVFAHILKYEDQEKTIQLGRDYGTPTSFTIAPDLYNFEEWNMQARWDIEMREPDDLPQNRAKRNEAKLSTMQTILNLPPNRAKMALRFLNLEDEAALHIMLDEEIAAQANQPPPPSEMDIEKMKADIKIQTERELMMMKARGTAAESIAQSMEHMANKAADVGNFQLHLSIIALIPQAVEEALNGSMIQNNQAYQLAMNQAQGKATPAAPPVPLGPIPQPQNMPIVPQIPM